MIISLIVAIALGWIFGLWLNKQAYDELKVGKKWFMAVIAICVAAIALSIIFLTEYRGFESLVSSLVFVGTLALTSYRQAGK